MSKHGTAVHLPPFKAFMSLALIDADIGISPNLQYRSHRIDPAHVAEGANISTPDLAVKYDTHDDSTQGNTQEDEARSSRETVSVSYPLDPEDKNKEESGNPHFCPFKKLGQTQSKACKPLDEPRCSTDGTDSAPASCHKKAEEKKGRPPKGKDEDVSQVSIGILITEEKGIENAGEQNNRECSYGNGIKIALKISPNVSIFQQVVSSPYGTMGESQIDLIRFDDTIGRKDKGPLDYIL